MPSITIVRHAETVASMLGALGPRERVRVLLVLRALGLTEAEAVEAIEYGLGAALFIVDPSDPSSLRARPWDFGL